MDNPMESYQRHLSPYAMVFQHMKFWYALSLVDNLVYIVAAISCIFAPIHYFVLIQVLYVASVIVWCQPVKRFVSRRYHIEQKSFGWGGPEYEAVVRKRMSRLLKRQGHFSSLKIRRSAQGLRRRAAEFRMEIRANGIGAIVGAACIAAICKWAIPKIQSPDQMVWFVVQLTCLALLAAGCWRAFVWILNELLNWKSRQFENLAEMLEDIEVEAISRMRKAGSKSRELVLMDSAKSHRLPSAYASAR